MAGELGVRARADREAADQQVQGRPDGAGVAVGTEVADALALAPPHHGRAGPLLVEGDGEPRVALVVLEADVVAGQVRLNERVLQDQGVDLAVDHHPLHVVGLGHHLGRAGHELGRVLPVVGQAVAQGLGLPHVEDPALGVVELVGARGVRDGAGRRPIVHHVHSRAAAGGRRYTGWCRPGFRHTTSHRGRHTRGWATRLSPPAISMHSRQGGRPHAQASDATSGALHVRKRGRTGRHDRRGQGRARVPAVHSRPPLPARRGHALGRRPGRLVRALPDRCRPGGGRVHRLLRRPLHGGVGRRPHGRPPAGAPPRSQCRLLHGRHGRHRPGGGGLGRAGPRHRRGRPDPGHLHELGRRPEGLRGPPRRCRLHVVQRPGRADLGPRAGRARALFFPDQHLGRNTGFELGYGADDMRVWNPRLGPGRTAATAR